MQPFLSKAFPAAPYGDAGHVDVGPDAVGGRHSELDRALKLSSDERAGYLVALRARDPMLAPPPAQRVSPPRRVSASAWCWAPVSGTSASNPDSTNSGLFINAGPSVPTLLVEASSVAGDVHTARIYEPPFTPSLARLPGTRERAVERR